MASTRGRRRPAERALDRGELGDGQRLREALRIDPCPLQRRPASFERRERVPERLAALRERRLDELAVPRLVAHLSPRLVEEFEDQRARVDLWRRREGGPPDLEPDVRVSGVL